MPAPFNNRVQELIDGAIGPTERFQSDVVHEERKELLDGVGEGEFVPDAALDDGFVASGGVRGDAKELLLQTLFFRAREDVLEDVAVFGAHVSHEAVLADEGAAAFVAAAGRLFPVGVHVEFQDGFDRELFLADVAGVC